MDSEKLVTKVTQFLKRTDGSEVRVVIAQMFGQGLTPSLDTYVHKRTSPEHPWILCSDRPHPQWREMSVDEYVKNGRSEMLKAVSVGELLKIGSLIGKPMRLFENLNKQPRANPDQAPQLALN